MKAILIINKPTECVDCPCAIESEGSYWCNAEYKDVTTEAYEGIPKWCPLKPMPDKVAKELILYTEKWANYFEVEKILGEQNGDI